MAEFNKGYYRRQGRKEGVYLERERIIKLLEDWGTLKITPYCEIPIWLAIELIRREM